MMRYNRELYLHSTMLLLYQEFQRRTNNAINKFTFHYASTLSRFFLSSEPTCSIYIPLCFYFIKGQNTTYSVIPHLHSTMLLLYRYTIMGLTIISLIYIPLCFYFIFPQQTFPRRPSLIYIPLCFYFIIRPGKSSCSCI